MDTFSTNLIFKGFRSGKSKAGNPYNLISFIQLKRDREGNIYAADYDCFVAGIPENVRTLKFGDVVTVEFMQTDFLTSKPDFVRVVETVLPSPYIENGGIAI